VLRRQMFQVIFISLLVIFGASKSKAQTYIFGAAGMAAPALSSTSPPSGNQPLITADFNSDGIPDIAIAGTLPGGAQVISIYLGKPDGTVAAPVNYPVAATGLAVGDFNGDGKLDLVAAGGATLILLGNGDGTFQTPVEIARPNYSAVAAADFNGDGKLDLALSTQNFGTGSTLAILPGNGDGTFQPPTTYSLSSGPYLAVGDFNGDGKPDIATAGGSTISVLIGSGNGTFESPVNETITGNIQTLAAADMNGDGKSDLVVPFGGITPGVAFFPGSASGTFGTPIVYTSNLLSMYGASVAIADFNGDGKLDLALTDETATNYGVVMLLGNGDGTFQSSPRLYSGGLSPSAIVALDVNGDGKPDFAVAGGSGTAYATLTVLLNYGDGTFPAGVSYPTAAGPGMAVAGDFNGDGKPDIAVTSITHDTSGAAVAGAISVLLGNGDGTFEAHQESSTANFPEAIEPGDFNGDGLPDLVAIEGTPASGKVLATWLGNGDGTFNEMVGPALSSISSLAVGDFNKDGKLDVAAVGINNGSVNIFLGNGDGTFGAPAQYPVGSMTQSPPNHNVLTGDFNGDGKLDLAVATDNGIAILLGNGDGSFQPYTLLPPINSSLPAEELLALADFNGDGKLDILRSNESNIIEVALGNGDGTFQPAKGYQLASTLNAGSALVSDFNGDGKPDAVLDGQGDAMAILFGNGDGTFGAETDYAAPWNASLNFIVSADFNGDGAPDVAMANQTYISVFVYLSSPVAAFFPRELTFAGQEVGTTGPQQTVALANPSEAPLAISNISASGDFTESNTCGSTLGPGKNCQVDVTFSPTATGTRTGLLSFTDNAEVSAQTLVLTGTGVEPLAQISPASLSFTSQVVGTTSAAQKVTLTNGGSGALSISTIATTGDFAETNNCGASLAAGASCSVSVTFVPTATGTRTGSLSFTDNAAGSPQNVPLSGTGTRPAASLSPTSLNFSGQLVGTTSATQKVTLTNSGSAPLSISSIAVTGDFAETNNCGTSLAAGASCSVSISFAPTASGTRTGSLTFTDNAAGSPQNTAISGTGEDFIVGVASGSSSKATVTAGGTATYSVSVAPEGGFNQAVSISCSGAPSLATCAVSPASVTPDGTNPAKVSITVGTTAASAIPLGPAPAWPFTGEKLLLLGVGLVLLAMLASLARLQPRRSRLGLALTLALIAMSAACGGGGPASTTNTSGGSHTAGTPTGTYSLTVSGSDGSLAHSTTLTLTVQ
jgi:hypothetical protein